MYLFELYSDDSASVVDDLRSEMLNYLTPLVSSGVKFITIEDAEKSLKNLRSGLIIDRGLVMRVLDPNAIKMVKKISGNRIYLDIPVDEMTAKTQDQEEKDEKKVSDMASKQAKKEISTNT